MSFEIPLKMRAVVAQEGGTAAIKEINVPQLKDNQILVKTSVVSLNPTDWKHLKYANTPGVIPGCEFAGTVVKVGSNLSPRASFKVGDRVAGLAHGSAYPDGGAFSEYVKVEAELVWVIPENITNEQAVTLFVGYMTAIQSLFHPERLALVETPEMVKDNTWIFIYGGSTVVGQAAIQLATLSNYKIITVASPHNHEFLKSLGADVAIDYRDPDVVAKIKEISGDSIHAVFDAFGDATSQQISLDVLAPGKGTVITTFFTDEAVAAKVRSDVTIITTWLYTVYGIPFNLFGNQQPAVPEQRKQILDFMFEKFWPLIEQGKLKPIRTKVYDGGLDDINEGIDYMSSGKVSAEKLVFRL